MTAQAKPSLGLVKLIRTYDDKRDVYVRPGAVTAVFDEGYDDFFSRHSCRITLSPGESIYVIGTPEEVLAALSTSAESAVPTNEGEQK